MLDKKTDNLNSENHTENSTSNPEIDKSELADSTAENNQLDNKKSENLSGSAEAEQDSIIDDSEKKEVNVSTDDIEEVTDDKVKVDFTEGDGLMDYTSNIVPKAFKKDKEAKD